MTNILKVIERLTTPDRGLPANRRTVNPHDINMLVEDWRRLDMTVRGPHVEAPLLDATDPNEVVIAFGGPRACGKTLMSNFIRDFLIGQGFDITTAKVEQRLDDVLRVRNVPATIGERLSTAAGVTDIDPPEPRSVWRHTSGRLYRVEEIANRQPGRQDRYPTTVVYRNVRNGEPYTRKLVDWHRSMTLVSGADDPDNVVNSDREGFMIEAAEQHGFVPTNDDATTFSCTQDQIIALLSAAYGPKDRPHYVNADPAVVEKAVETIKADNPPAVAATEAVEHWYLGAMNDGLFIINTPPRTSTEGGPFEWPDGPTMVLNVSALDDGQARAIVEAHNASLGSVDPMSKMRVLKLQLQTKQAEEAIRRAFGTTPFPLGPGETIRMSGLGLGERPASINEWIDKEVNEKAQAGYAPQAKLLTPGEAAEIARGAALHMIADKAALITNLANEVHAANVAAGWWTDLRTGEDLHGKRNVGELLCLVHSELSEAIDGTDESDTVLYRLRRELAKVWTGVGAQRDHLLAVHQAISRAMEGHRKSLMDDKLPHRPTFRVELVDALIRLLDILGSDNREHPAGTIFVEKRDFNATRADHTPEHRRQAGGKGY